VSFWASSASGSGPTCRCTARSSGAGPRSWSFAGNGAMLNSTYTPGVPCGQAHAAPASRGRCGTMRGVSERLRQDVRGRDGRFSAHLRYLRMRDPCVGPNMRDVRTTNCRPRSRIRESSLLLRSLRVVEAGVSRPIH
jgi:hypothetical protein